MNNFAFIKIIRTFSKQEIKEFGKMTKSPYFGGGKYVYNFWRELKKYSPELGEKQIEKRKIFSAVYPGREYDDTIIRKVSSVFLKMTEKFLAMKKLDSGYKLNFDIFLAAELRERGLNRMFENKAKALEKIFDEISVYDFQSLNERHLLQVQWMNYATDTGNSHKNFEARMRYYEYGIFYFLCIIIQETARIWVETNIYNNSSKFNIVNELLNCIDLEKFTAILNKKDYRYNPTLKVNIFMMNMYRSTRGYEDYFIYRDFLFLNGSQMPRRVAYFFFIFLINYCLKFEGSTEYNFVKELSVIFDKADEFDIIRHPVTNIIVPANFLVAAEAHTNAGEFDKVEKFITKYSVWIKGENSDYTINYTYANLWFAKKEFEKALEIINRHEPFLAYDKVNFRITKLMLLFELNRWEEFSVFIDSTRQFIRTTELISSYLRQRAQEFLNIVNKLFDMRENISINDGSIHQLITENEELISKEWLKSKYFEIVKQKPVKS